MKKIFQTSLAILAFTLIFSACSGVKNLPANATGASRARFVGTWNLIKVSYSGLVPDAVQTVFDQAPPKDFIGSTWQLTNSGNGIYTLLNGTSQTIFWSYNKSTAQGEVFQFKKIFEGDKAKNVAEGYQLIVAQNDGRYMAVKSPVFIGNQKGYIIYTFQKKLN
jgi:hypothetical protein